MNDELYDDIYDEMDDDMYDDMYDEMDGELYGKEVTNEVGMERIGGYLVSDIELCVERNTEYYLDCFRKQSKLSFNGSALVFSGNWMIYRHMWAEFLIWNVIDFFLSFAAGQFFITTVVLKGDLITGDFITDAFQKYFLGNLIFTAILFFIFGNFIYWNKIKRELNRMNRKDSTTPMTEDEKDRLQKKTRVSGSYVAIAVFLYMLMNGIGRSVLMALLL